MYSNEDFLLQLLVEAGAIDEGTLDSIRMQLSPLDNIIEHLIENKYLTHEYIAQVAANNSGLEYVDVSSFEIDPTIIASVKGELARRVRFLPLGDDGFSLLVRVKCFAVVTSK